MSLQFPLPVTGGSAPATLTGSCGLKPGLACRLVWDVSHNAPAAELTGSFLAGPVHLLLRLLFAVLFAFVMRFIAHRVINRLTERAAHTIPATASRLAPGRLIRHPIRRARRHLTRVRASRASAASAATVVSPAPATPLPETETERVADMASALVDERHHQRIRALGSILRSVASVTIFTIAGVQILSDLSIQLGPLIASAGVVGVAVGFGAQNLVRDYLSGIFMLLEDQYGVGDSITLGEASGTVETVTLRITRIRDTKGVVWHIRNGAIEKVGNQSQGWARAVIDYPVPYDARLAQILDILRQTAGALWNEPQWRALMLSAPEVWGAQQVEKDQVTMRIVVKTAPLRQWAVEREMRARIHTALLAADIHFPPPAN